MVSSMTTTHWDEAPTRSADVGPMGADWTAIGRHAGTHAIGLRRIAVWPGRQSTPLHAHQGEEETFYVLSGAGSSVTEKGCYAVGEGDVVHHAAGGPAHTLVAGEEGLDVLAFGAHRHDESVRFPRIGAAWIGAGIVATRPEHQFALEAPLGPVEVKATPDPRPANIVTVADLEPVHLARPPAEADVWWLGRALGMRTTALNRADVVPGGESAPPHCHSAEEELFVVLGGDGVLVLSGADGDTEHPVREGSVVSRPSGTGVAHTFRAGDDGLSLLLYSDKHPNDMCFYPRSGKVALRGLGVIFRPEQVGYWD